MSGRHASNWASRPVRRFWPVGLAAVTVLGGACGGPSAPGGKAAAGASTPSVTTAATLPGISGASGGGGSSPTTAAVLPGSGPASSGGTSPTVGQTLPPFSNTAGYTCSQPQHVPNVQGNPHVSAVPAITSVSVVPSSGGLGVQYRFADRLPPPPEGVYYSWTVWLYRHRSDAAKPTRAIDLQVEDRGAGWEPSGWAIAASTYTDSTPVAGQVQLNQARTVLTTFFPPGFVNLKPPFFWYASQEEYRAYLPTKAKTHNQDYSVNGAITIDCPSGVRQGPYSLPEAAKLLSAA